MIILPLSIVYIRNHTKVISTTKPICIDNSAYFPQQRSLFTPIYAFFQILLCFLSKILSLTFKNSFAYWQIFLNLIMAINIPTTVLVI